MALTLARFIDDLQRRVALLEKDEDELSSPRSFVDQDRARPEDGRTLSQFLGAGLTLQCLTMTPLATFDLPKTWKGQS